MKFSSIIFISFVLVASLSSQQRQKLTINKFGGLNTESSIMDMQPGESRIAHNIDWAKNFGLPSLRSGYDSISTLVGHDSILAIWPAYFLDGRRRLIVVADSADVGYGNIYATNEGSTNIEIDSLTRISTYWGIQSVPSFMMFDNWVYIANGRQHPKVWTETYSGTLPPNASGEPTIVPLDLDGAADSSGIDTTTWKLDGVFYYMIDTIIVVDTVNTVTDTIYPGVHSRSVRVENGRILLTDFQWPQDDTISSIIDSIYVTLLRSRGNISRLEESDSVFEIFSDMGFDSTSFANFVFIDSLPDDSLGVAAHPGQPLFGKQFEVFWSSDSSGVAANRLRKYGAPSVMFVDNFAGDTSIYNGWTWGAETTGVAYVVIFQDTVTGNADTSASCWIQRKPSFSDDFYKLSIPQPHPSLQNVKIDLYRAPIKQIGHDTLYQTLFDSARVSNRGYSTSIGPWVNTNYQKLIRRWLFTKYLVDSLYADTYYFIAHLDVGTTTYTDTLAFDSILAAPEIHQIYIDPPTIRPSGKLLAFQDRAYTVEGGGSVVYYSDLQDVLDYVGRVTWDESQFLAVNRNDGDLINFIRPARGLLRLYKRWSTYNMFASDDPDIFDVFEISSVIGSVAPFGHVSGINGHYYVTHNGIILETEGGRLARTFNASVISAPIKQLRTMSLSKKERIAAAGIPTERKILFCDGDTTWVFDELIGYWSSWDLLFQAHALYGATSGSSYTPADTFFFVRPGDSVLMRYGSSETDNGTTIDFIWRSGGLLVNDGVETVTALALWVSVTSGDTLFAEIRDQDSTIIVPKSSYRVFDPDSSLVKLAVQPDASYFHTIEITNKTGTGITWTNLVIHRIEEYYETTGISEEF